MAKFISLTKHNDSTVFRVNIDHIVYYVGDKKHPERVWVQFANAGFSFDASPGEVQALIDAALKG